jgi:hypothetical protein
MTILRQLDLKILAIGLLTYICPSKVEAQHSYVQHFAAATILLTNGDTIRGPLILHRNEDVIRITMPDKTVHTLSAIAVKAFIVKGEVDNNLTELQSDYPDLNMRQIGYSSKYWVNYKQAAPLWLTRLDTLNKRVFLAYRWNRNQDYSAFKSPSFFELLSDGPTKLLRRQYLEERVIRDVGYTKPYTVVPRQDKFYSEVKDMLFLGTPKGEVVRLRNPKKDLLSFFQTYRRQIEQYAKQNKLHFTDSRELACIVNYANSISAAEHAQE